MAGIGDPLDLDTLRSHFDWLTHAHEADEHVDVFINLGRLRHALDQYEHAYVLHLRDCGHTWPDIGNITGSSYQAAFNRHKRLERRLQK